MEDLISSIGINKRERERVVKGVIEVLFYNFVIYLFNVNPPFVCDAICVHPVFYHLYFLQFNLEAFWCLFVHRSVGVQPQEDEDRQDLPQMRDPCKHSVDVEGDDDVNLHEERQQGRQAKKKDGCKQCLHRSWRPTRHPFILSRIDVSVSI